MSKQMLLEKAVEIIKEYARGGGPVPPAQMLRFVYEELKRLNEDVEGEA